jgi:hypothetical protein
VKAEVYPITDDDLPAVADFLHRNMTSGLDAESWLKSFHPGWHIEVPNHGFMLVTGQLIVGVYAAYYARRIVRGQLEDFCNLGAWCVLPDYRLHGTRLLKALLAQPGFHFVDLSPSGNVIGINELLGFEYLDTSTALIPVLPWIWHSRIANVSADPSVLENTLTGHDLELYRDHANAAAARHLVLSCDHHWCYVVFRLDRRRNSPKVFASLLHVSNPKIFRRMWRSLGGYLLFRHRVLALLVERQVLRSPLPGSILLSSQRRKMYRSATLSAAEIDYFYSELVSLEW